MVENLQSLTGDVEEGFGWKLRGELQMEPRIMLLATATSRFDRLDDVNEPFFELFRILNLEPLATDDCRRLWEEVSGDQVSTREMRPLEILTGGSPRLLVIVAEFARHRSLRQLMEELVTLVDEHTEYFRGHLEALAKTERRVYLAVIDLWQPSAAGEIAARSRLDVRTVSTMLGRLAERGAVIAEGTGRKRRYAAAERLYSIYYKLRRERDEAAVVQSLIRFMAAIYSKAEMADITSGLRLEMAESPVIREGILRAIAESPHIGNVLSDLWPPGIERPELDDAARFGDSDAPEIQERVATALLVVKGVAQYMIGNHEAAIAAFDELIARFGDSGTPEIQTWVASALSCKGLSQTALGRADESLRVCAELDRRLAALTGGGRTMFTWRAKWLRAAALLIQGKHPAAMEAFRSAYAGFAPENVTMMREIAVVTIPRLIAARCFRARPCRDPLERRDQIRCVDAAHYCSTPAHGRGGTRTNRDAGSRGGYPQTNREDNGNGRAGGPSFNFLGHVAIEDTPLGQRGGEAVPMPWVIQQWPLRPALLAPILVGERAGVKQFPVLPPLRHELIHQRGKAVVVCLFE